MVRPWSRPRCLTSSCPWAGPPASCCPSGHYGCQVRGRRQNGRAQGASRAAPPALLTDTQALGLSGTACSLPRSCSVPALTSSSRCAWRCCDTCGLHACQGLTRPWGQDFKIQNVVGSTDVRFPVRLEGLAFTHNLFCSVWSTSTLPRVHRTGQGQVCRAEALLRHSTSRSCSLA